MFFTRIKLTQFITKKIKNTIRRIMKITMSSIRDKHSYQNMSTLAYCVAISKEKC